MQDSEYEAKLCTLTTVCTSNSLHYNAGSVIQVFVEVINLFNDIT